MSTDDPLVSVVLPTYNRPEYVERAIASVVAQTYDRIELVVVDDCSDHPIEEVVDHDSLDRLERYEFERHDENRGGSAARNTGIRAARGDYLALLDDDDRWRPEKIARQVERIRNSEAEAAYTGDEVVDDDGERLEVARPPERVTSPPELTKRLLCRNFVGSCSLLMVSMDVVERAGPFDERFPSWQDQEWYVRLSRYCSFAAIPDVLVVQSEDAPHRVSNDVEAKESRSYPLFVSKFEPLARSFGRVFRRKMLAWAAFHVGKALLRVDRVAEGRRYLLQAVRSYPLESRFYPYLVPSLGGRSGLAAARSLRRALD